MSFWTGVKDGVRNMVIKMLKIQPAQEARIITIKEPLSHETNVLRNRLWYRGDPSELDQFFKQTARDAVAQARFWAAVPSEDLRIRKIHSGLPAIITETLAGIVTADLDGIDLEQEGLQQLWDDVSTDNHFDKLLGEAVNETLVAGDGAFKLTVDPEVSEFPLIEFFSGEQVEFKRTRGRLQEVVFYSDYLVESKTYRLRETYGRGFVKYVLLDERGKEVPLATVQELADLQDVTFTGNFIMAVPLMFFKSPKWKGRGKSLFDNKNDSFDALDEVISQWVDAVRAGRVQKYIPMDLIPKGPDPRNPDVMVPMKPNPFDNQFIKLNAVIAEKDKGLIDTIQPKIYYEAFVSTYANVLDMCLQGIVSPSTLGIDLKKLDNAEAQREKEKATLYTRGKIIEVLNQVIPQLVNVTLKVYDTMKGKNADDYISSVTFGEYASPDFGSVVEVVSKAKLSGIMSIEQVIEELYGDSWTDEEKAAEVLRLKVESGMIQADEPKIGDDANQEGVGREDDGGEGNDGE